jgi:DNA adenine methylase
MMEMMMLIKSIGGKAQQVPELLAMCPPDIQTYYEPFAGSAALFWELKRQDLIKGAVLNDRNRLLMDVYRAAQNCPQGLSEALDGLRALQGREPFESIRAQLNAFIAPQAPAERCLDLSPIDRAAYMLYLNRRTFNGLFRVNQSGELNMPWGADSALTSTDRILEAGKLLQGARLDSGDFEASLKTATKGDFVFADPPYIGTFSGYSGVFGLREHRRLEKVLASLDYEGVRWLVCNSEAPEVRQIWRKWNLQTVQCRRNGNRDGAGRGNVPELRISNY